MGSFNASLKTFGDHKGLPATVELDQGRLRIAAGDTDIGDWPLDEISLEPVPNGYRLAAEGEQLFLEMADREQFADELSQASKKKLTLNGLQVPRLKVKRGEKKKKAADAEHPAPLEAPDRHAGQVQTPTNVTVATEAPAPARPPVEAPSPKGVDETAPRSTKKEKKKKKKKKQQQKQQQKQKKQKQQKQQKQQETKETKETKLGSLVKFAVAQLDRTIDTSEKRWGSLLPGWVFNRIVFVQAGALVLLAIAFPGPASTVLLVAGLLAVMVGGAAYSDDVLASKLLPGRTTATHVLLLGVALLGLGILAGFVSR